MIARLNKNLLRLLNWLKERLRVRKSWESSDSMSEFMDKVVVVTGGANGIGKCITEEFRKEGTLVEVMDKAEGEYITEGRQYHAISDQSI